MKIAKPFQIVLYNNWHLLPPTEAGLIKIENLGVQNGTWDIVGTNLVMRDVKIGGQDYELWLRKNLDPIINFAQQYTLD